MQPDTLTISERLQGAINEVHGKLLKIPESEWEFKASPEKWSKREILGHLVDSAANNHIRFVRAQLAETEFSSFAYEQNFFVSSQDYQNCNTQGLLNLWLSYNKHIAHVIASADPQKLTVTCKIGSYEPVTLGFMMNEYVDHLNHHLQAILK